MDSCFARECWEVMRRRAASCFAETSTRNGKFCSVSRESVAQLKSWRSNSGQYWHDFSGEWIHIAFTLKPVAQVSLHKAICPSRNLIFKQIAVEIFNKFFLITIEAKENIHDTVLCYPTAKTELHTTILCEGNGNIKVNNLIAHVMTVMFKTCVALGNVKW